MKKIKLEFSEKELEALYDFLMKADVENYESEFESVLQKVESALPENIKERLIHKEFEDKEIWYERQVPKKVINVLAEAIANSRRVKAKYFSLSEGKLSERLIEPYGIVRRRFNYLVGYCCTRKERRIFRVDRIVDISLTDGTFKKPEMDLEDFLDKFLGR